MSKALSLDLRQRVIAAVKDERLSHRVAAARFKVGAASISRWRALERQFGDLRPEPLGGDRRSAAIEAHADTILRIFEARRDMTIEELRSELNNLGLSFGYGTLWRFLARHRLTRKRMARPVRKGETGWHLGLHQRIRSQDMVLAKMGSARPRPHKVRGVRHHIFDQAAGTPC